MEKVCSCRPSTVTEVEYRIRPEIIGYCELHGNPMRVRYLKAYQGNLWVGDCGCSSNNVDDGYEVFRREHDYRTYYNV
jgi:hypothetical protein